MKTLTLFSHLLNEEKETFNMDMDKDRDKDMDKVVDNTLLAVDSMVLDNTAQQVPLEQSVQQEQVVEVLDKLVADMVLELLKEQQDNM